MTNLCELPTHEHLHSLFPNTFRGIIFTENHSSVRTTTQNSTKMIHIHFGGGAGLAGQKESRELFGVKSMTKLEMINMFRKQIFLKVD